MNSQTIKQLRELSNETTINLLRNKLTSRKPGEVLYALDLLEKLSIEITHDQLESLLHNRSPEVRQHALDLIREHHPDVDLDELWQIAQSDRNPEVIGSALRAYGSLSENSIIDKLEPFLHHEDLTIREGAIVGLLLNGSDASRDAIGEHFTNLIDSPICTEREIAANVIGSVADKKYFPALEKLLHDEDAGVRKSALIAAGQINKPEAWQFVIDCLANPEVVTSAVSALFIADESVYPAIRARFEDDNINTTILRHLVQVCGRRSDDGAVELLLSQLDHPDQLIQDQVMLALAQREFSAPDGLKPHIEAKLREQARLGAWVLSSQQIIQDSPPYQPLCSALEDEFIQIRHRILLLLSFLYDSTALRGLRSQLLLPLSERTVDLAAQLQSRLPAELAAICIPIYVEDISTADFEQFTAQFSIQSLDLTDKLQEIFTLPDLPYNGWLKSCALYGIGKAQNNTLYDQVVTSLNSQQVIVLETAIWSLYQLDSTRSLTAIEKLRSDTRSKIVPLVQAILNGHYGESPMLLTIEKVLILKNLSLFSQLPDHILIEIASVLEEMSFKSGDVLFDRGDVGDCMYIIVDGHIRLQTEKQVVADLKSNDILGEMALFDNQPRSTSAKAMKDLRLLRLDKPVFDDLMQNHPEMMHGFIRVLVKRLRDSIGKKSVSPIVNDVFDLIIDMDDD